MAGYPKKKKNQLVAGLIGKLIKKYYQIDIYADKRMDLAEKIADLVKSCESTDY